jgi:hypothetical protein
MERREARIKMREHFDCYYLERHKLIPPVDFLANYKSRFEQRGQLPTIERQIIRKGVILYERR